MPGPPYSGKGRRNHDRWKNLYGVGSDPDRQGLFRKEPEFANLQIQGEVSNFRQYPSGHCYFNLKDGKTLLKAVMFAGAARRLKQLPKNGDQVLGVGRIDLYERDGVYQSTWT